MFIDRVRRDGDDELRRVVAREAGERVGEQINRRLVRRAALQADDHEQTVVGAEQHVGDRLPRVYHLAVDAHVAG